MTDRIHRILEATGSKIVLCSTWRKYKELISDIKNEFGDNYVGNTVVFPWWKKVCPYENERQWEVEKWIDEHQVDKWVCIDDEGYPVNRGNGIKVKTESLYGLTEDDVYDIIRFMNQERKTENETV